MKGNHILNGKTGLQDSSAEHLFPVMGRRKGRGRRRGKGKTGNHILWKYNKKQALRFPENMGIELNTG